MNEGLKDAIEDLAGEVRSLSDRIDDLDRAVRGGSPAGSPGPAADSSG